LHRYEAANERAIRAGEFHMGRTGTSSWGMSLTSSKGFGVAPRILAIEGNGRESTLERFARVHRLSPQETKLVSLAVHEVPNKQTAGDLGCSECTVRTYWHRIFAKVGCTSQRDLLARLFQFAEERRLESADQGCPRTSEKADERETGLGES
jgi:DNA-binding CsgD family transcriptional regulator